MNKTIVQFCAIVHYIILQIQSDSATFLLNYFKIKTTWLDMIQKLKGAKRINCTGAAKDNLNSALTESAKEQFTLYTFA